MGSGGKDGEDGVCHLNRSFGSARAGDSHNFELDDSSTTSGPGLEAQEGSWRANHGVAREAYVRPNSAAYSVDLLPQEISPPSDAVYGSAAIGMRTDDETVVWSVGSANQVMDPRFDETIAAKEPGVTLVSGCDSVSPTSNLHHITDCLPSSSPKRTAAIVPDNTSASESHDRGGQGADIEAPTALTLDQQRLQPWYSVAKPRSHDGGASLPFHDQLPQMTHLPPETIKEAGPEFENISRSSPIPDSSQPEPEMRPSTPLSSNETLALASPVRLDAAEANLHSTPPSSPMKLTSPPPLKPPKKSVRHRTGLGAPFKSPFRQPIPCALPSSPLPPSSPPPLPDSSPEAPAKKRRAVTPPEDRLAPSKVRRTGPSPFSQAPFVSPLRNSQNESRSRTRPPAGGFSTPLRPSRIQQHTFSSPAMPTEPDVFTTPATATSVYKASALPSSDPVFEADSSSTPSATYKLRPPRTRTAAARPFKPPAKSARPTSATVQALKQRLQSLRNALRIRGIPDPTIHSPGSTPPGKVVDDDELEALGLRWRNAAREAAQDLWALVKDSASEDSWSRTDKNSKDSWGWAAEPQGDSQSGSLELEPTPGDVDNDGTFTPPDANKVYQAMVKKLKQPYVSRKTMLPPREDAYEYADTRKNEMECSDQEEDIPKAHTLGTMLTSLGISHEVLGWQEEEGEFVG